MSNSLFILGFLLLTCPLFAQTVYISGKISHPKSALVSVDLMKNAITGELESYAGRIEPDGNFVLYCPLSKASVVTLFHANETVQLFLFPSDSLYLLADANNFANSIRFSGRGAERNQFMANYHARFVGADAQQAELQKMKSLNGGDYTFHAKKRKDEKINFLQTFFKKTPEVPFYNFIEERATAEWANDLLDYPVVNAMNNNQIISTDLPPGYYSFTDNLFFDDNFLTDLPFLPEFLKKLISFKFKKSINTQTYNQDNYYNDRHAFAEKYLQDKPLYLFQAQNIIAGIAYEKVEKLQIARQHFIQNNVYAEYTESVQAALNEADKFAAGQPAPHFSLTNEQGNSSNLSDFRQKVVYLDFWATWCAPCRSELPHSQQLKAKLNNPNIVFAYISLDTDPNLWTQFLAKNPIQGTHLWAAGLQSDVAKAYNVKGLPRYLIIAPDGTVWDGNAKRPSEQGLEKDLLDALQKGQ